MSIHSEVPKLCNNYETLFPEHRSIFKQKEAVPTLRDPLDTTISYHQALI